MFKISTVTQDENITFKLEGKLVGEWVEEAWRTFQAHSDHGARRRLDLSELTFVDGRGARLLRDLVESGATIVACTNFVSEVIHAEKTS